ncbi:MAG TPA: hypothetical protein VGB64_03950 [Actinomycetota bacterium]
MRTRTKDARKIIDLTAEPARIILPGDDEPDAREAPRRRRPSVGVIGLIVWSAAVFSAGYAAAPDPPRPSSPCIAAAALNDPPVDGSRTSIEYTVGFTWNDRTIECREWFGTTTLLPGGGVSEVRRK